MASEYVSVTLPIPDRNTGGNARGHGLDIYKVRKRAKYGAALEIRAAMNRKGLWGDVRWTLVKINIDWCFTNASHRPDRDNAISRCKPYIDAAREVGLIVDDSPDHVAAVELQYVRAGRAGIQMTIHRLDGGS